MVIQTVCGSEWKTLYIYDYVLSRSFKEAIRDREKMKRNRDKCPTWLSSIAFLIGLYPVFGITTEGRLNCQLHNVLDSKELGLVTWCSQYD